MRLSTEELTVDIAVNSDWFAPERAKRVNDRVYIPFGSKYAPIKEIVDICAGHRAEIAGEERYNFRLYNVWLVVDPNINTYIDIEFPFDENNNLVGDPCAGLDEVLAEPTSEERELILDIICQVW